MSRIPVIAIFDIGKTNKKLFLFDEHYDIVFEESSQLKEITDDDGFPCEDVLGLTDWIKELLGKVIAYQGTEIKAVNFSTYGASFVHVDKESKPTAPLYNYLKPYPEKLQKQFYKKYGGEITFSQLTASPVLGSLNSGLQLYRLKKELPEIFKKTHYSLHLPQYISSLITGKNYSDITSIGCHTGLWNFPQNNYHEWVYREAIHDKLPEIFSSSQVMKSNYKGTSLLAGVGLHDSSAALIPYLSSFIEPFILVSTGTWCISLNPFNHDDLTADELNNDCLCYIDYLGRSIKASRLFAGYEHEQQIKRLAEHFHLHENFYKTIEFDAGVISKLSSTKNRKINALSHGRIQQSEFVRRQLSDYPDYSAAYHDLILDIISQQIFSTNLVLQNTDVKRIFVDGGFSKNSIYMHLMAAAFPGIEVYAATVAQASAMGTAQAIHKHWNKFAIPSDLIELKYYSVAQDLIL
jgi:sugar (pentulose or hexulose) kinase